MIIALVIATAGYGAVSTSLSLVSSAPVASIGTQVPVDVTFNGGPQFQVVLFAGTQNGSTTLVVGNEKVTLPISGIVFQAGASMITSPTIQVAGLIPDELGLVGEKVIWVGVILDPQGRVVAIARTGGPVIEDAIC